MHHAGWTPRPHCSPLPFCVDELQCKRNSLLAVGGNFHRESALGISSTDRQACTAFRHMKPVLLCNDAWIRIARHMYVTSLPMLHTHTHTHAHRQAHTHIECVCCLCATSPHRPTHTHTYTHTHTHTFCVWNNDSG